MTDYVVLFTIKWIMLQNEGDFVLYLYLKQCGLSSDGFQVVLDWSLFVTGWRVWVSCTFLLDPTWKNGEKKHSEVLRTTIIQLLKSGNSLGATSKVTRSDNCRESKKITWTCFREPWGCLLGRWTLDVPGPFNKTPSWSQGGFSRTGLMFGTASSKTSIRWRIMLKTDYRFNFRKYKIQN